MQLLTLEDLMKTVFVFAFRGTGRSKTSPFASEPPLIKLGHVGFALEENPNVIWGFRPTDEAASHFSDDSALINHLSEGKSLPGTLYNDYAIFARAAQLQKEGAQTEVRRLGLPMSDEDFDRLVKTLETITITGQHFNYALPSDDRQSDNCATFPKRIGVPLWNTKGIIREFMDDMIRLDADRWRP